MSNFSTKAVMLANANLLAALVVTLNEKGVLSTTETAEVIGRAFDGTIGESSSMREEIRTVFKGMFPNVTLLKK